MAKRLILLRHEVRPDGMQMCAYLNELTHHTYAIAYFPKEPGWMMLDSGVVPSGGKPGTPQPIAIPGEPGRVYGFYGTHAEAKAARQRGSP